MGGLEGGLCVDLRYDDPLTIEEKSPLVAAKEADGSGTQRSLEEGGKQRGRPRKQFTRPFYRWWTIAGPA